MKTLYVMRGLPASGKSTKRREMMADASLQPLEAINKDEIRIELNIPVGDFKREKEVKTIETEKIVNALTRGVNLIIDNTHNSPKYLDKYRNMAKQFGYEFELIDFSHVSVEECISRDALRVGREKVGSAVILRMYNDFYRPRNGTPIVSKTSSEKVVHDKTLPWAVVIDLDGTLFEKTDRSWYDFAAAYTDDVVHSVQMAVWALKNSNVVAHLIFLTGRDESGRDAATRCLADKAGFTIDGVENILLMKNIGDHRPDTETKFELFDKHVRDKYFVLCVFEDKQRVVDRYRELGVTVFQVAVS